MREIERHRGPPNPLVHPQLLILEKAAPSPLPREAISCLSLLKWTIILLETDRTFKREPTMPPLPPSSLLLNDLTGLVTTLI